jgi:CTP:molybdopterin cytidylyltransferase MocA
MRGSDKLLQPVDGIPLLREVVKTAVAAGGPVTVTIPPDASARRAVVADLQVTLVDIPDAEEGMSRSLVRGLASITDRGAGSKDGLMVLPADMPGFRTPALADLIRRFQQEPELILRGGTGDGRAGHPAIFPRDLWPELSAVRGDEGGRSVLLRHPDRVRVIPLPGTMATLDLDTPEDWAAYLGRPWCST